MDTQNMQQSNKPTRFFDKKIIFMILGGAVLLEVIWAGYSLLKPTSSTTTPTQIRQAAPKPTVIILSAPKTSLKVGEKAVVSIKISSDKKTVGTDLIITYDPKFLSVAVSGDNPVTVGSMYSDYPINSLDPTFGKITVSGITDLAGGVLANGLFGTIVFQAKASGVANINLDFTPGKTTDSNVIESGTRKDLLQQVNNLKLNILP